ncbi:hypothetical protein N7452_003753 [Penicillium brevicompactum]|uniref:Protein kinase domain-containing protein n=1 Tax=Penicillium brevicompactum TaxID=5074 RepID=A0A9W9QVM8_PENBR|nr:hypothetical protein N7452_003753 [Penicillium brevicompactum]
MDPLSIAASTAALAHVLHKVLGTIQSIRDAPTEMKSMSLQISSTLDTLQKISRLPRDSFVWKIIEADLERASEAALSLNLLLQGVFKKGGKINYAGWIRRKSNLYKLRTELKDLVAVLELALELSTTQRVGDHCYDLIKELKHRQDEVLAEIRCVKQLSTDKHLLRRGAPSRTSLSNHTISTLKSSRSDVDQGFATDKLAHDDWLETADEANNEELAGEHMHSPAWSSPYTKFETSSSFYPEQYTIETQLHILEASYTGKKVFGLLRGSIHKVCLIYAERSRTWRRLTLSFSCKPDIAQVATVTQLLPSLEITYFDGVTNISHININEQSKSINENLLLVSEDEDERGWDRAWSFANQIDDLGCAQFVESEVVAISAINGRDYYSLVRGERCIEKKLTFAMDGNDNFSDFYGGFFSNIKSLHILRFSRGVVRLKGVVLDDRRRQVKSYLIADAELGTLGNILRKCKEQALSIPWSVLEDWAREIVTTVADIHSQNLVVGRHGLWSLVLDKEGHVRRKNVDGNTCLEHRGWTAPEVRPNVKLTSNLTRDKMCAKTDLFQLGLELWLLARREPGYGTEISKMCCKESGCPFKWRLPGRRCLEAHSDPIELPPCGVEVPTWFQGIVDVCRSVRPEDRLAARKLLEMFPRKKANTSGWARRFAAWPAADVTANEAAVSNRASWWRPRGMTAPA